MSSTGENIHHYIKMETIIEANNQFTVDLVKRLSGNENVLFSPLSIISALAMVFLGTNRKTSTRIEKILHLENDTDLNSELRKLVDLIQGSEDYQVFITNGMFVEQALNISEEHKKDVKKWYNSEIKKINFSNSELVRQDINTWLEEQTRGKIQNLLPKNSTFSKSKVIAINTIYLLANWTDDLPEYKTQKALFTISTNKKVPVDMMSTMGMFNYRYIHDQKIRILELPYGKNKQLSMYIILPEEQINLAVLTQNVSYEHITNWTNSGFMEKKYVKLYLPRFTIDYTTVLNKMFPSLEISDVLTRMTNVSELAKNKMSTLGIFHNAWLKVDEAGTEKASEEIEKVLEIAVILPEIEFKIDHPFIFMVKQKINNCILFFGRFQSPGE